jgi:hypothetical protein
VQLSWRDGQKRPNFAHCRGLPGRQLTKAISIDRGDRSASRSGWRCALYSCSVESGIDSADRRERWERAHVMDGRREGMQRGWVVSAPGRRKALVVYLRRHDGYLGRGREEPDETVRHCGTSECLAMSSKRARLWSRGILLTGSLAQYWVWIPRQNTSTGQTLEIVVFGTDQIPMSNIYPQCKHPNRPLQLYLRAIEGIRFYVLWSIIDVSLFVISRKHIFMIVNSFGCLHLMNDRVLAILLFV